MTKDVRVIRPTAEGSDAHKTRVAAYCRVSTDSADQVNSFIAQVKYDNDYMLIVLLLLRKRLKLKKTGRIKGNSNRDTGE